MLDQRSAGGGYRDAMRRAAEALAARSRTAPVRSFDVACLYLDAGEKGLALDWLQRSFESREPELAYLDVPFFDRLGAEPRFRAIAGAMGLPL